MKRKWFLVALKYVLWLIVAAIIYFGFLFLYKEDNWLGISALATLLLAIAAFWTIKQNSNLQKRERKERLLNEIIEWAKNVAKSAISRQTKDWSELWKTKLEYKYHMSIGKYIEETITSSFKELSNSFKNINSKLDEAIKFTEQVIDRKGNSLSLKDYETEVANSVELFLQEIAKIKAKI